MTAPGFTWAQESLSDHPLAHECVAMRIPTHTQGNQTLYLKTSELTPYLKKYYPDLIDNDEHPDPQVLTERNPYWLLWAKAHNDRIFAAAEILKWSMRKIPPYFDRQPLPESETDAVPFVQTDAVLNIENRPYTWQQKRDRAGQPSVQWEVQGNNQPVMRFEVPVDVYGTKDTWITRAAANLLASNGTPITSGKFIWHITWQPNSARYKYPIDHEAGINFNPSVNWFGGFWASEAGYYQSWSYTMSSVVLDTCAVD